MAETGRVARSGEGLVMDQFANLAASEPLTKPFLHPSFWGQELIKLETRTKKEMEGITFSSSLLLISASYNSDEAVVLILIF